MGEPVYTTGEIANFVGVNFRTVIRWIERGQLDGYKLPGRGDHRVTQASLLQFLKENDIPLPQELKELTKRVLVVDDEAAMAKAIARVFKRKGWEVRVAQDGFEAGVELGRFRPTLMTLDLKMPFMNGLKVLELTRRKFGLTDLKVLVISAQPELELRSALEAGANAVLAKPFENEQLQNLVDLWFPNE